MTQTERNKNLSKQTGAMAVNRTYKSRIFTMVFQEKEKLLELYNAISGKNYHNPELLEINTLENAIYMGIQNDLSFLIDSRLSLYEHQSTINPNLPLRFLWYISNLYMELTKRDNPYGTKLITLPTPQFLVFYNGEKEQPDRQVLRLSDLYQVKEEPIALELTAIMLNVNRSHNPTLMEACKTLRDYAEYVYRVRNFACNMPLEDAVELAITQCIREGILKDFLEKNRREAKSVSIFEYNEEEHIRMERADAREEGERGLLWRLIQKKLEKGKSISQIADELEETEEKIQAFIKEMEENPPCYDDY